MAYLIKTNPKIFKNFAKYVYGLTDEFHKLRLIMIKESLEMMTVRCWKALCTD